MEQPVNISMLKSRFSQEGFISTVIHEFIERSREQCKVARGALISGVVTELYIAAHTLHGLAACVRAEKLKHLAALMENEVKQSGMSGPVKECGDVSIHKCYFLLSAFVDELLEVVSYLCQHSSELGGDGCFDKAYLILRKDAVSVFKKRIMANQGTDQMTLREELAALDSERTGTTGRDMDDARSQKSTSNMGDTMFARMASSSDSDSNSAASYESKGNVSLSALSSRMEREEPVFTPLPLNDSTYEMLNHIGQMTELTACLEDRATPSEVGHGMSRAFNRILGFMDYVAFYTVSGGVINELVYSNGKGERAMKLLETDEWKAFPHEAVKTQRFFALSRESFSKSFKEAVDSCNRIAVPVVNRHGKVIAVIDCATNNPNVNDVSVVSALLFVASVAVVSLSSSEKARETTVKQENSMMAFMASRSKHGLGCMRDRLLSLEDDILRVERHTGQKDALKVAMQSMSRMVSQVSIVIEDIESMGLQMEDWKQIFGSRLAKKPTKRRLDAAVRRISESYASRFTESKAVLRCNACVGDVVFVPRGVVEASLRYVLDHILFSVVSIENSIDIETRECITHRYGNSRYMCVQVIVSGASYHKGNAIRWKTFPQGLPQLNEYLNQCKSFAYMDCVQDDGVDKMVYSMFFPSDRVDTDMGASDESSTNEERPCVLLAANERLYCALIKRYLKNKYDVSLCDSENIIVEEVEREMPDFVIMDVNIMQRNDFACVRRLRKLYSAAELPILMIAGQESKIQPVLQGYAAGVNECIAKPFSKEHLLSRLEACKKVTAKDLMLFDKNLGSHQNTFINSLIGKLVPDNALKMLSIDNPRKNGTSQEMEICALRGHFHFLDPTSSAPILDSTWSFMAVSQFFMNTAPIVSNHGGFVDKFSEEGLLCFLNRQPTVFAAMHDLADALVDANMNIMQKQEPSDPELCFSFGFHFDSFYNISHGDQLEFQPVKRGRDVGRHLHTLARKMRTCCLVSGDAIDAVGGFDAFEPEGKDRLRYLGRFAIGKGHDVAVYEYMGLYTAPKQEAMIGTRGVFDMGIELYEQGDLTSAADMFDLCCERSPTPDGAAEWFRIRCRNSLRNEMQGVTFSGITRLVDVEA